jgi:hypothetical protein
MQSMADAADFSARCERPYADVLANDLLAQPGDGLGDPAAGGSRIEHRKQGQSVGQSTEGDIPRHRRRHDIAPKQAGRLELSVMIPVIAYAVRDDAGDDRPCAVRRRAVRGAGNRRGSGVAGTRCYRATARRR